MKIDLISFQNQFELRQHWQPAVPVSNTTNLPSERADIDDAVLLVRINRLYRDQMSAADLYEATRGVWRLSVRRENARYALAVFDGVVREVYAIESWHRAGSRPYRSRDTRDVAVSGRWEFVGQRAPELVRVKYVGRSVADYFSRGQRNPISYVNC